MYYTLVNTLLTYDSVGWGLPFGSWFPDVEHQQTVEACGDLIALLIDFEAAPDPLAVDVAAVQPTEEAVEGAVEGETAAPAAAAAPVSVSGSVNAFTLWLASISSDKEFGAMIKGMTDLLTFPLTSSKKLPGVEHVVLIMLWRMIDRNERFLAFLLKGGDVLNLMVPALFYMHR
jgi:hypothetical protein